MPRVAADRGGVEAGVNTGEEDDEDFGGEIREELIVRGELHCLRSFSPS